MKHGGNRSTPFARTLIAAATCGVFFSSNADAGGFKFDELWKRTADEFATRLYKATKKDPQNLRCQRSQAMAGKRRHSRV